MSEAVWVTGQGAVTPAGRGVPSTWQSILESRSHVAGLRRFETFASSSRVAALVPGSDDALPEDSLSLRYGLAAAEEAMASAGLTAEDGVDEALVANHGERRLPRTSGSGQVQGVSDIARTVSASVGAKQFSAPYGACAGSAQAIGTAMKMIRQGRAQVVLAGGCDALVSPFDYFSFSSLYVMTTRECEPEHASCPFDRRRDGFALAEGAAFLVLESAAHARSRGAQPLAMLEGCGLRQNAYHMFAPPPDGLGPAMAMSEALRDAGVAPQDVQAINAHGTSTKDNDSSETIAIRDVFGPHADSLAVSANKSQIGHTMAACGAIEAVITIESLRHQVAPATINLQDPDPRCDLDYVPGRVRPMALDKVLSNSFGFGGHSASLLFGRVA
jgi:3-oxoacyl-[acyl-carrier-protein] synthase II